METTYLMFYLIKYLSKKVSQSGKGCENIWPEILTHVNKKKIRIENIFCLSELVLHLPSILAPLERIFS